MPDMFDPYAAMRGQGRRSSAPTAYYFLRTILIAGAIAGGLVALYRNDVFLDLSRRVGQEPRYLELEQFLVGTPGWGTPRSMQPVLDGATPNGEPADAALAAAPAAIAPALPVAAEPQAAAVAPSVPAEPASPVAIEAAPAALVPAVVPPPAAAPVAVAAPAAPFDPLAPVSLDSLPLLPPSGGARALAPVSVSALPALAPARGAVSRPAPSSPKSRAVAVSLDEPAPARARKAPAAEPAPAPAPVAKAPPEPKAPKATEARTHDNPLTAAIRGAVRARPAKDSVPE